MAIVLLHIAHETRAVDVAVPDDQPVDALMPHMLAAAGVEPHGDTAWRLVQPGHAPLRGDQTLQSAAVGSGVTLRLLTEVGPPPLLDFTGSGSTHQRAAAGFPEATPPAAPPSPPPGPAPPPPAGPPATTAAPPTLPSLRTRAALPGRRSRPSRAGLAMGAVIHPGREESLWLREQAADHSPAALTRAHRLGPVARARRSWGSTDYRKALEAVITAPRLVHCVTIAVMSPKGGVGKTTITALLGTLLAQLRRDRIVAIDTNPDYGSLGRTLAPGHNIFVDDLLAVLGQPALTVTQLDTSLARAHHGLLVLPAPTDPERMARLDEDAYRRVIGRLQEMVSVIVLDCGTGLWEPAARAALGSAQQIVLVSDAEPATASLVAEASTQLRRTNVPVTLVVNKMSKSGRLDVDRFAHAIDWASGLITLADDRAAAASIATGDFMWERAPRSWRTSARELAAVIADDWGRIGLTL